MSQYIEKSNERPSPEEVSPPPTSPNDARTPESEDDGVERRVLSSPEPVDERQRQHNGHPSPNSADPASPSGTVNHHRRRSKAPWNFNPSLVLENSGSVARDHLASERTFLAYVRTSLAIASTGVALVQLFTISVQSNSSGNGNGDGLMTTALSKHIQVFAKPLGSTAVCFGILVLLIGTTRYFTIQSALTRGKFPVARVTIASMAFILATIVIIVFVILVTGRR
ncbi:hypothetical protein K435DRAFT_650930 [Dendrothele bispora CBS 962.96]|uniref:DUF202 domain-containing protein n=1 Tax=Dendrothele bispora (strain CBS 962.96) TaxID=1314807 RepID=A0A4S8MLW6_DENBC|nr:hypothetical protein K435DRAFT_650930 [Dendrothele bispora CBS 962.96]